MLTKDMLTNDETLPQPNSGDTQIALTITHHRVTPLPGNRPIRASQGSLHIRPAAERSKALPANRPIVASHLNLRWTDSLPANRPILSPDQAQKQSVNRMLGYLD